MTKPNRLCFHGLKPGGAACLAALLLSNGATAQTAPPDSGAGREVVVTATRIPTDIQDVGSSVTVITGADMTSRAVRSGATSLG